MMIRWLFVLFVFSVAGFSPAQESERHPLIPQIGGKSILQSGNLRMLLSRGDQFVRVDNIDHPGVNVYKAGVPDTNLLLAAYVDKRVLDKSTNNKRTPLPYFSIQTSKEAVKGESGKYPIKDLIDILAKQHKKILDNTIDNQAKEIVARIQKKADEELPGQEISQLGIQPVGVIQLTDNHVTILMHGTIDLASDEATEHWAVAGTMTVMGVDSFPVYLYVFHPDDGKGSAVKNVIELTDSLRASIK